MYCFMLQVQTVFADPFMSYPGTRARAMGGAFCGVADDASAVWYNPAGLAEGESFDLVLEWSQAVAQDEDTKRKFDKDNYLTSTGVNPSALSNEENKIFFAIKWADETEQNDGGVALYYMSPYTIDWYYPPKLEVGNAFGSIKEDMNIYGLSFALSSLEDRLLFGASLEYINFSFETEDLYHIFTYDSTESMYYYRNADTRFDNAYGFSGSLGILGVVYDNREQAMRIKLGGVYRFSSSCSADTGTDTAVDTDEVNISEKIVDQLVFSKPASYDIGFSINKSLTFLKSAFLFSGQYGVTDWSKTNDTITNEYKKTSFGVEWQINFQNGILLALRSGMYTSEASEPETGWPDVNGFTIGIGTLIGEGWGIDCTNELRDISFDGGKEESISLLSIALTVTGF